MPGKPFVKPNPAQHDAFNKALKHDAFKLLRRLGGATVQHVVENPTSPIGQVVTEVERSTGAFTVLARGLNTLMSEDEPTPTPPSAPKPDAKPGPQVYDAEFVDEK